MCTTNYGFLARANVFVQREADVVPAHAFNEFTVDAVIARARQLLRRKSVESGGVYFPNEFRTGAMIQHADQLARREPAAHAPLHVAHVIQADVVNLQDLAGGAVQTHACTIVRAQGGYFRGLS